MQSEAVFYEISRFCYTKKLSAKFLQIGKESQINKLPTLGAHNFRDNKAFLRFNAVHWVEETTQLSRR